MSQTTEKRFDDFAETYDEKTMGFGYSIPAHIIEYLFNQNGSLLVNATNTRLTICDIGVGTGLLCRAFIKANVSAHLDYNGCDISAKMLAKAQDIIPKEKLHRINVNQDPLPWPVNFADISISSGTFEFIHEKERAIAKMAAITKPGGLILISTMSHQSPLGKGLKLTDEGCISPQNLSDLFRKAGLNVSDALTIKAYDHPNIAYFDSFVVGFKPDQWTQKPL